MNKNILDIIIETYVYSLNNQIKYFLCNRESKFLIKIKNAFWVFFFFSTN